jgi:catechol 2,3-dioxygenase-like lactoylglutathione lyase family enzyme
MKRKIAIVSLVVRDYDEAIDFFVNILDFELVEDRDVPEQNKRWVVVAPPGGAGANLLLAKASNERQASHIGDQTGGRVFLFLYTDNFNRDYDLLRSKGVVFEREPKEFDYGTVAVFQDLYGNLWDLLQPSTDISWR